jgi:hypothetical protein
LVALLCVSLFRAFPCKAATAWSDNFDRGNYNGWTVIYGNFSIKDGALNPISDDTYIYHSSMAATGTWSFDAYYTAYGWGSLDFMLTMDNYGYQLGTPAGNLLSLKRVNGESSDQLVLYSFPRALSGWQHFDITRDSNGRICIYYNGTLVIDITDTAYTESQFFVYYTSYSGQAIDNIFVSDTIDIQPPPPPFYTQTWFLPTVGAAVVAAVVAVFLLSRKNHS